MLLLIAKSSNSSACGRVCLHEITKKKAPACAETLFLVNQRVFEWNSCKRDMTELYLRLKDLGMECKNGQVYLSDIA
jgi:hypothetical protein